MNISSVSGVLAVGTAGTYAASKHALEAMTDALAEEMYDLGVHVAAVNPGNFATEIGKKDCRKLLGEATADWGHFEARRQETIERCEKQLEPDYVSSSGDPIVVARVIEQALFEEKPRGRYLVASQEGAGETIAWAVREMLALNIGHDQSYTRDEIVQLIDLMWPYMAGTKTWESQEEEWELHSDWAERKLPRVEQAAQVAPFRFEVVSANPIEHGKRLSAVLGCIGCHKRELTGEDWSDAAMGVLWTANLTHSAAEFSSEALTAMITEGQRPDRALMDMPSFLFSEIHPEDVSALVRYLKSLPVAGEKHPDPTIGPKLAADIASGEFRDSAQRVVEMQGQAPPDLGPEHAFARHILRATCAECHNMDLSGSTEQLADAPPRPDLRMVAAYSADEFASLMKTGKGLGDRELKLMGGVARWRYSQFTDNEIESIYRYLVELAQHTP